MKINSRRTLLFFCLFQLFTSKVHAQKQTVSRIDSLMQAVHRIGVFNGNLLVAKSGKVIYHKAIGYADASRTKLLDTNAYFDIGSISKEFNGVGIMLLQEAGKLQLTDPVAKYLPELPAWAKQVRLTHLVNYTSGIPISKSMNDNDYKSALSALEKLNFEPGTGYLYSNDNVYLQKRIIEKVSGMSYADFINRYIFQQLRMKQSIVDLRFDDPRMARAFDSEFKPSYYEHESKGWIRLTASDLYRWIMAIDQGQLISKPDLKVLSAAFKGGESSLGNAVYENDALVRHFHHGSNYNYEALMVHELNPDITIILMTNSQQFKVAALANAITAILKGEPYTVPKKSLYLDLRDKVLADFDSGIRFYEDVKKNQQDKYDFSFEIGDLVNTAKYLMRRKKFDDAIRMLELGKQLKIRDSDLSFVYQLMGECYANKGNKETAIRHYRMALDKDPENKIAKGFLEELLKNSTIQEKRD